MHLFMIHDGLCAFLSISCNHISQNNKQYDPYRILASVFNLMNVNVIMTFRRIVNSTKKAHTILTH